MDAKSDIAQLIELAETYGRFRQLALSSVSLYAANSGKLLPQLKAERCSITLARRDAIFAWFCAHWPADLPWPAGVPRPSRTKTRRAA